jgi:hypothetical protein
MRKMTLDEWAKIVISFSPLENYTDGYFNLFDARIRPHMVNWVQLESKIYDVGLYFVFVRQGAEKIYLDVDLSDVNNKVAKLVDGTIDIAYKHSIEFNLEDLEKLSRTLKYIELRKLLVGKNPDEIIDYKKTEQYRQDNDPLNDFQKELMISFKWDSSVFEGQLYLLANSDTHWICTNLKDPLRDTRIMSITPTTIMEKFWIPWVDQQISAPENIDDYLHHF